MSAPYKVTSKAVLQQVSNAAHSTARAIEIMGPAANTEEAEIFAAVQRSAQAVGL